MPNDDGVIVGEARLWRVPKLDPGSGRDLARGE